MMNNYETPFAEFEEIETEDVILTSGGGETQGSEPESQTNNQNDFGDREGF